MKKAVLIGLLLALVVSVLPLAAFTPTAEAGGCRAVYVVKRGDTLAVIARKYGTTVRVLVNANNIKNANRIVKGMRICIPGKAPHPQPPPQPWPHPHPYPPPPPHQPCQPSGCWPPPPPAPPGPACNIMPVQGFGNLWYSNATVRNKLGCPTAVEQGFKAVDQPFCYGYAVEDVDNKIIYVLHNNHTWEQRPATWTQSDAVELPWVVPPPGYYEPVYSIGKMWRESDLMQRLSWATTTQRSVSATRQPFAGGMMLWTSANGVYVLYNDGTWSR